MKQVNESPDITPQPPRRRRAMRADVHIAHEAMKVAQPANERIGSWQQRAAWLLALAERRSTHGRRDARISREARELLEAVAERRDELERSIKTLPAAVAQSSRLDDTLKALDSITDTLQRTLQMSGAQAKS